MAFDAGSFPFPPMQTNRGSGWVWFCFSVTTKTIYKCQMDALKLATFKSLVIQFGLGNLQTSLEENRIVSHQ